MSFEVVFLPVLFPISLPSPSLRAFSYLASPAPETVGCQSIPRLFHHNSTKSKLSGDLLASPAPDAIGYCTMSRLFYHNNTKKSSSVAISPRLHQTR